MDLNAATNRPTAAPPNATIVQPVVDSSHVGEARRAAVTMAGQLHLNETRAGELAIIVTELTNNLVRHGGGGELLLRPISPTGGVGGGKGESPAAGSGVEVLAIDRGPGIASVNDAMRDGYSTGGTPGTGLGAVRRLAAFADFVSWQGRGTAVVAHVWPGAAPAKLVVEIGVVCVPLRTEVLCGDAWCVVSQAGRIHAMVADGLGHGPAAAEASQLAIATFRASLGRPPKIIMDQMHAALRVTRGAAIAVAEIDRNAGQIRFCGVGNVASMTHTREGVARSLLSHNGTVGAEARRIVEHEQMWKADSLLILTSDGLTSRWQVTDYPGLLFKHPSLIAGILYRDHLRGRDDATALVLRAGSPAAA